MVNNFPIPCRPHLRWQAPVVVLAFALALSGCVFGGDDEQIASPPQIPQPGPVETAEPPRTPHEAAAEQVPLPGEQQPAGDQVEGPYTSIEGDEGGGLFPDLGQILPIPGQKKETIPGGVAPVMGINSYLWRSTLDTLSFMPLLSADPVGGVIITDWYANPGAPDERFKVTVYILDQRLRADGLKVSVFKQDRQGSGWVDAAVDPETPGNIEDAILTRARQLRVAQYQ